MAPQNDTKTDGNERWDWAPCPVCGKDPTSITGSDESEVGECDNPNCSVLQYEATREVREK